MYNFQSNKTNKFLLNSSYGFRNSRVQIVYIGSLWRAFLNIVQVVVNHDADHMTQFRLLTCTVQLHAHLQNANTVHHFTPTGDLQHCTVGVFILTLASCLLQQ